MRTSIAAALAALSLVSLVSPSRADQILGPGRIDSSSRVLLPGGPTLGTFTGGKFTSKPDMLQIQGQGSTGDVSAMSYALKKTGAVVRTLADRLGDQSSVKDFGALCNGIADDTAGFQAAISAMAAGSVPGLYVPSGAKCQVSAALSATLTVPGIVWGAGMGASEIAFTGTNGGIAITVPDRGSFSITGLTIKRAAASPTFAGTGLSVTAATANNTVNVDRTEFRGATNDTTAWAVGLALKNTTGATVRGSRFSMTNGAFVTAGAGPIGIDLSGASASLFGVDTKISDAFIQGGNIGIRVGDWVQGVFVTNSEAIGLDYGVYWEAPGTLGEYLTVNNTHINAGIKGIYLGAIGQSLISNNLFLRFDAYRSTGAWTAMDFFNSHNLTVTGNQVYGAATGTEAGVSINATDATGGQPNSVTGNSIASLAGPGILLKNTVVGATVTGNAMNGVLGGGVVVTPPPAWTGNTAYQGGQAVLNAGTTYTVTTGGTSAASGGPSGTAATITDGTVKWSYVGPTPVGHSAIIGNTLNGEPDISAAPTIAYTKSLLPRDTLNYALGGGSNIFSALWVNQIALSSGGVASVLAPDAAGNVTLNAPSFATPFVKALQANLLAAYTVAQLQGASACVPARQDWLVVVVDAVNPTYRGPLTGGGSVRTMAYCDGSTWTAH